MLNQAVDVVRVLLKTKNRPNHEAVQYENVIGASGHEAVQYENVIGANDANTRDNMNMQETLHDTMEGSTQGYMPK